MALSSRILTHRTGLFATLLIALLGLGVAGTAWLDHTLRPPLSLSDPAHQPTAARTPANAASADDPQIRALFEVPEETQFARTLLWREGQPGARDLEAVQALYRTAIKEAPASCPTMAVGVWMYLLDHRMSHDPVALHRLDELAHTYEERGCAQRLHLGRWDVTAEIYGVGYAFASAYPVLRHGPRRDLEADAAVWNLTPTAARRFEILAPNDFCRRALPPFVYGQDSCLSSLDLD